MSIQENKNPKMLDELPITHQLVFLIETMAKNKDSLLFKDRKKYAIIGASVADLLLKKKARIVNNKVLLETTEERDPEYLSKLLDDIQSSKNSELLSDILYDYQFEADEIEEIIFDELLDNEILIEKKGFIPFLFPSELHVNNPDILKQSSTRIRTSLEKDQNPDRKTIYLLAITDAINFLRQFFQSKEEYKEKKRRLKELMGKEYGARIIYDAIKNQPEPELPTAYYMPPLYFSGGLTGMYR